MAVQQRSDAIRNRSRILETAREQITAQGPDVSMDELARSAGVAVGTLYRHFPTKADLILATLEQHVGTLADQLESALHQVTAGDAADEVIHNLLASSADSQPESRLLKEAARSLGVDSTATAEMIRLDVALAALLEAGIAAGDIRPGVTPTDIYLLMSTMPTEQPEPIRRRWAELIMPGILTTR